MLSPSPSVSRCSLEQSPPAQSDSCSQPLFSFLILEYLLCSSNRNILGTPAFATLPVLVLGIHMVRGNPKTGNPRQPGTIKGYILKTCKVGKACIQRPCLVRDSF